MNKAKPGLGEHHYEDQLIANLRASLNDHMLRYHPYLDAPSRGIILKFYDKQVDRDNIQSIYSHPCEDFLQALVNRKLHTLVGKSSARLTRNPSPNFK